MESLWRKQSGKIMPQSTGGIGKETERDIVVIGAGLAGLLTAWYLQEAGKDVLVLEAREIASGQTERTTAKISSQHGLKYSKLIKNVGIEKARLYAQANEAAIREYEKLINKHGIRCQFEKSSAFLYSIQNETILKEEAKAAATLGVDAQFTKETELPFSVAGAVEFRNQAQFSPLEFVKYIASKLEIWEHTKVVAVQGRRIIAKSEVAENEAEDVVMRARKVVVATHYPLLNIPGFYFLRQHQERSYVMAFSGCGKIRNMYLGMDDGELSFRQAGEFMLLGGISGRTGSNVCGGAFDSLEQAAKQYYPGAKEVTRWAAQDCMPHDEIPFIGKYSFFSPHIYVVTGFQKWGMTNSMIAAMLLRDEICGRDNPYAKLYTPQRLNVRAGMRNFLKDVGISAKGLFQGLFFRPRCSHMGCKLVWNPEERSWDCPCHGSRFDENGKWLDNPAKNSLTRGDS